MPRTDWPTRSPRIIPFAILGLLSVLAVAAAAIAVANAPAHAGAPPGDPSVPRTAIVDGDTVPVVDNLGPSTFTVPGPFAAGEQTTHLSSDGAPVEIWYPATPASAAGHPEATYDIGTWLPPALQKLLPPGFALNYATGAVRGLPVAAGRFPLVVFSHGFSGYRDQSTFLTARLATWGFVVAAPDLVDHDLTAVLSGRSAVSTDADVHELEDTISLMGQLDRSSGAFSGRVDMSRVAAIGHSLGGAVAEEVASADSRVTTFIGMAGASVDGIASAQPGALGRVPDKPGMLMVGTADHVVPAGAIAKAFAVMTAPKRLVTLSGAGHLVFADICRLAPGQGGLLVVAARLHITVPAALVPLASDGCQATDLPVRQGWVVIRQAVTAQLRHVFGWDSSTAGLDGLRAAYPNVVRHNIAVTPG